VLLLLRSRLLFLTSAEAAAGPFEMANLAAVVDLWEVSFEVVSVAIYVVVSTGGWLGGWHTLTVLWGLSVGTKGI
jgi:hypothetical protein